VVNAAAGWRQLGERLTTAGVKRVGIEASGGYERGAVNHLRVAGFTVLVLQPLQIKAWAKVHLRRAKNDRIDAALIAACAALVNPPAKEPDPRLAALADYLTFLEQIDEDVARLKTRLEHLRPPRLRRLVTSEIARLQRRRENELRRLLTARQSHADLTARCELVLSVPGIGERTALALLIPLARTGRAQPRAGRRPGRSGALRRRQRYPSRATPYRRRPRPPAMLALCRRPAPPPSAGTRPSSPSSAASKSAASRITPPRRLRPQTPHLRQHRRRPRHTVAHTISRWLMLATASRSVTSGSLAFPRPSPAGPQRCRGREALVRGEMSCSSPAPPDFRVIKMWGSGMNWPL
jgi:transposase